MQDNARADVSNAWKGRKRILIANTRVEARALASRVETVLLARGYEIQTLDPAHQKMNANYPRLRSGEGLLFQRVKAQLLKISFLCSMGLARRLLVDRRRLSRVLTKNTPDAIVIFDDRPLTPNYLLRILAARRSIPVVLIPFAISTLESDIKSRDGKATHQLGQAPVKILKSLIARHWPNQIHVGSGKELLFHGVWDTIAMIACGTLPHNPWFVGGSRPEIVCVAGGDQRRYFLEAGVPADRIILTGLPSLDELAEARNCGEEIRQKMIFKYGLSTERPLIICAVPQYAEHDLLDWNSHKELTTELFATLAGSGANVLLSLHPKSQRASYESVAAAYGLKIIEERLSDVLAAADLLVGAFSSTISWALGLGIPAFIAATIHAEYQLYRDVPGVVVVEDHQTLAKQLSKFVHDREYRAELTMATELAIDRIGRLDGKAGERVASAMDQLLDSGPKILFTGKEHV